MAKTSIAIIDLHRRHIEDVLILASETDAFDDDEIEHLSDLLLDFVTDKSHDRCVVAVLNNKPLAFSYFGPEYCTDGSWYLWWIAVCKDHQRSRIGSKMVAFIVNDVARRGGKRLYTETSNWPSRSSFYFRAGFRRIARLRDFFGGGVHKEIWLKKTRRRRRSI